MPFLFAAVISQVRYIRCLVSEPQNWNTGKLPACAPGLGFYTTL
jgi:hypothetical protein